MVSKSTAQSIKLYNGRNRYDQWIFVYSAASTRPGDVGAPGQPTQPAGPGGLPVRGQRTRKCLHFGGLQRQPVISLAAGYRRRALDGAADGAPALRSGHWRVELTQEHSRRPCGGPLD